MFTWSEIGMFFAGFLFGFIYWRKEIFNGFRYLEWGKQAVRNQEAYVDREMRVEICVGCIFCGVKKEYALSDACYKDRAAELLIQDDIEGKSRKNIWTEMKFVNNWDFLGESPVQGSEGE